MRTQVAVLGEPIRTAGYGLTGVKLLTATTAAEVRRQWSDLPADVGIVVLTASAAEALGLDRLASGAVLTVVLPP
ncbi:hypothetical protein EV651_10937 [Kribbella sp. VKM Ac-2571]|uniref:hypothetical protein n=1 Tax=Kribbella sp. VKM Ac-2571 TaxID=2512222 RepID=UPI001060A5F4|nr:hypothetical protein [Kribbella sp. VKM Ac-2571]TDO58762.1 hypothetical protein EV651_10937 [Kribbella sp. VKM Ac-2571]